MSPPARLIVSVHALLMLACGSTGATGAGSVATGAPRHCDGEFALQDQPGRRAATWADALVIAETDGSGCNDDDCGPDAPASYIYDDIVALKIGSGYVVHRDLFEAYEAPVKLTVKARGAYLDLQVSFENFGREEVCSEEDPEDCGSATVVLASIDNTYVFDASDGHLVAALTCVVENP